MNSGHFVLHTSQNVVKIMAKTIVSRVAISRQLSASPSKMVQIDAHALKHLWPSDKSQKAGKVKRGYNLLAVLASGIIY